MCLFHRSSLLPPPSFLPSFGHFKILPILSSHCRNLHDILPACNALGLLQAHATGKRTLAPNVPNTPIAGNARLQRLVVKVVMLLATSSCPWPQTFSASKELQRIAVGLLCRTAQERIARVPQVIESAHCASHHTLPLALSHPQWSDQSLLSAPANVDVFRSHNAITI